MRPSLRALLCPRRQVAVFRPHIHSLPCVICDAAIEASMDISSAVSPPSDFFPPVSSSASATVAASNDSVVSPTSSGWPTTVERRRKGLQTWLQRQEEWNEGKHRVKKLHLEKYWEAFCDPARILTKDDIAGTVDFLDQFCERKLEETLTETSSDLHAVQNGNNEKTENAFLSYIETVLSAPADIERQMLFQRTLLDFRAVANELKLPLFLCCGTALGAHREGHFIPHDKDIDVGIFFEDLQRLGGGTAGDDAQSAVVSLLSQVALDGHFVLLDVCGVVEKGLELRFLHHETRVALDLNVYYPPLAEDTEIVRQCGPFVWTASYYEAADSRRHGMYRYRHAPFRDALIRMPFCESAVASPDNGFLVPPTSYLNEYFGDNWRTPREYTYTEALHNGEYKNIIEE